VSDQNEWEGIEQRQYEYLCLGLTAGEFVRDLREIYSIPDRDQCLVNRLQTMKEDFDKKRKARESPLEEIMTSSFSE
jgi:hypothetical protein